MICQAPTHVGLMIAAVQFSPSSHVRREVSGVGSITQREAAISLLTAREEEGHLLQWSET